MTDADTVAQHTETFAGGTLAVTMSVVATDTVDFVVKYDGELLDSEQYERVFDSGKYPRQQRATVANWIRDEIADKADSLNPDPVREDVHSWLKDMKNQLDDIALVGPDAKEILEATQTPVEIRPAPDENTTLHATLEFRGQTNELIFDVGVLVGDASGELMNKVAHNFYGERIEITSDDWDAIADYWADNKTVTAEVSESGQDAVTNRFLSFLSDSLKPTTSREELANSPNAAWIDPDAEGATGTKLEIDPGTPVVWVTDDLFVDEMESASLTVKNDKGPLVKDLKSRQILYGQFRPRSWTESSRPRVWAFDPDVVGVDVESFDDGAAAGEEVAP